MLFYKLKIAWLSIRRNPVLSALLVVAIALGIATSTASLTAYKIYASDPIPHKSDRLFYVELDSWEAEDRPFDEDEPDRPPNQITYMDMIGLMQSDIPTRQSGMTPSYMIVQHDDISPFGARTRLCYSDFFAMFDVPFAYGGGWDDSADQGPEPVVVIDAETNQKLFGGADSVGRQVRLNNHLFTVVGVLQPWRPTPRFYDPHGGGFTRRPAAIFLPFGWLRVLELGNAGTTMCHGTLEPGVEGKLTSECVWIQMWVELDSPAQQDAYLAFLDAYAMQQKKLGRFQRPLNNRVLSVNQFLRDEKVVPEETKTLLLVSLLFLIVCSVNLIGILLGKFLARAPEVGVRRALGASRTSVFLQHLVECEVLGLVGGGVGLGLSVLVLRFLNRELNNHELFVLDANIILAALVLSLAAGLMAGIYPAWRVCRVAPAFFLKLR